MTTGTFEKQSATIYDLVAAGEIEGVVGGLSGVYLNDTSIVDAGTVQAFQPIHFYYRCQFLFFHICLLCLNHRFLGLNKFF